MSTNKDVNDVMQKRRLNRRNVILSRNVCVITNSLKHCIRLEEKKEEIWLSPITKAPTPTEKYKKQPDNIKNTTKTLITQRLRNDLGRSVRVRAVNLLVWFNRATSAQPSH